MLRSMGKKYKTYEKMLEKVESDAKNAQNLTDKKLNQKKSLFMSGFNDISSVRPSKRTQD